MTLKFSSLWLSALFALGVPSFLQAQEGEASTPPEAVNAENQDPEQDPAPALPQPQSLEEVATVDLAAFDDLEEQSVESLATALEAWRGLTNDALAAYEAASGDEKDLANGTLGRAQGVFEKLAAALSGRGEELSQASQTLIQSLNELAESKQADEASELTPAEALALDINVLKAQLRPLELEAFEGEDGRLAQWTAVLKKKAERIKALEIAEIAAGRLGDGDTDQQNEDLVELRLERDQLVKKFNAVITEYERKGGDGANYTAYAESLSAELQFTGFKSALIQAKAWLISEDGGVALGLSIITFLAILFAFRIIARIVSNIADRAIRSMRNSPALLRNFVVNTSRKLINFIGLVVALGELGVNIGPFIAAIGAVGFVIGFALQGTLSNFAAGIMVMLYRPFDLGDVVSAAGVTGKVDGMTLVSTTVKTFDNQTIVVPNSMVWGDVITNITANSTRRVDLTFGIGYGDDIEKALGVLTRIVDNHPMVLKDPAPTIKLHELGDSSVNFVVRPWSKTADYWDVYWDITRQVKEEFDKNDISIPFPQQDVHMHQVTGEASV